jgi:hypothetical protein
MDEIKKGELLKLIDDIFSGVKEVGVDVNYDDYSEEELNFIDQEMYRLNTIEVNKFTKMLEEYEKK